MRILQVVCHSVRRVVPLGVRFTLLRLNLIVQILQVFLHVIREVVDDLTCTQLACRQGDARVLLDLRCNLVAQSRNLVNRITSDCEILGDRIFRRLLAAR